MIFLNRNGDISQERTQLEVSVKAPKSFAFSAWAKSDLWTASMSESLGLEILELKVFDQTGTKGSMLYNVPRLKHRHPTSSPQTFYDSAPRPPYLPSILPLINTKTPQ